MNNINREYESFVRIVCNDSPYDIKDYFMEQDVKELFDEKIIDESTALAYLSKTND